MAEVEAVVEQEAARTLITLEQTPEPQMPAQMLAQMPAHRPQLTGLPLIDSTSDTNISPIQPKQFAQHETKYKKGLSKGISKDNIKASKRERRPATFTLNRVHLDTNTDFGEVYYSAFTTGTTLYLDRVHSRNLPRVPRTYKELSHYPYSSGFK